LISFTVRYTIDLLGDAYEYLMQMYASTGAKSDGEFYNIAESSYVEQYDTREAVDIKSLNTEIARIVARQPELRTQTDAIVGDLAGNRSWRRQWRKKDHYHCRPNGAGKTTFARSFLPAEAQLLRFINADLIAAGLAPFAPETAAIRAGRLMLQEIQQCAQRRESFAFETTLSGLSYLRHIENGALEVIESACSS
jgi:N-6 DNA Methylase